MYLKRFRDQKFTKTIGFKLTLWSASVSMLISLLLFSVAYLQVSKEIEAENRYMVKDELSEYITAYQFEGWKGLADKIKLEQSKVTQSSYFVRIVNSETQAVLLNIPNAYKGVDIGKLEQPKDPQAAAGWVSIHMPDDETDMIEVAWHRLPNGTLLQVGRNSELGEKLLEQARVIFIGIIAATILLGFMGGGFLAYRALRPIKDLIATVTTIKNGKMDARVPTSATGDELDHLTTLFNDMLNEMGLLVNGLRETLDNVAHDLRTPITRIKIITERALSSETDCEKLKEVIIDCAEEADRISLLLTTLMDIAEVETGAMLLRFEQADIGKLLRNTAELYQYVAEDKGVTFSVKGPDHLLAKVDQTRFRQVVANLLDNAVKYTEGGGCIDVTLSQEADGVAISVRDTGVGIPPADIPKIFDRLYRSDKSRHKKGLGLGLSLAKAIINAHHGRIEVESQLGEGSTFTLFIPAEPEMPFNGAKALRMT